MQSRKTRVYMETKLESDYSSKQDFMHPLVKSTSLRLLK